MDMIKCPKCGAMTVHGLTCRACSSRLPKKVPVPKESNDNLFVDDLVEDTYEQDKKNRRRNLIPRDDN